MPVSIHGLSPLIVTSVLFAVAAVAAAGTGAAGKAYPKGKMRTEATSNDRARFIDPYLLLTEV